MHLLPEARSRWLSVRWIGRTGLLLALALVCVACGSPTTFLSPTTTVSRGAPRPLAASAWEQIALPVPATDIRGVFVVPADPATIFACAGQPLSFWRTTDAGAHWTRHAPTLGAGQQCTFSAAPDDPQRVTLEVWQTADNAQPCAHDSFFLSSDGGATWQQLPRHISIAPTVANDGWCDLHVTRHHLYLAYSFTRSAQGPQVSLLERSDDDGANWVRADRGLGDNALFFMPEIGSGETLAVTVTVIHTPTQAPPPPPETNLWLSTDAGDTWQRASTLPEGAGAFLWASRPIPGSAWPTVNHPFYALEHEQIPSDRYRERVLMSGDGQQWALLPPLPVSGASANRPGVLQALAALPDGRLAIWGPDPQESLPKPDITPGLFPAFWLWFWDPVTRQWQPLASPLKTPAREGCGPCWQAFTATGRDGATYLYVSRLTGLYPGEGPPGLFRMRLPTGG